VSTVGLGAVARHNTREGVYDEQKRPLGQLPEYITHLERVCYNAGNGVSGRAIYKRRLDIIKNSNLGRKPQKNAAAAVEFSISASPEFFTNLNPKEWPGYFSDVREFLGRKYGVENVLSWNVHCDETTPHMHLLMTPIITTSTGKKYSSSAFLGGRNGLRDLQTEIYESVGRKWGLERGIEGSGARHSDQFEWYAERTETLKERERKQAKREQEFESSQRKKLKGWELPEAKPLESGKKYRARVGEEVMGKVARALAVVDSHKTEIKKAVDQAVADNYTQMKQLSDTCYRLQSDCKIQANQAETYKQKYTALLNAVLEANSGEDLSKLKQALQGHAKNYDRGYSK
jgi:hypothetical protein